MSFSRWLKLKEKYSRKYPIARGMVDGREVLPNVDNISSIGSTLDDYEILPGIREVPLSDFHLTGKSYSVSENKRIEQLAMQIAQSNQISPLIIVVEEHNDGDVYILEGGHRAEALTLLNAKSFPAVVVISKD